MNIYIYNDNLTEQSERQMSTILTYINCNSLYMNPEWKASFENVSYFYTSLNDFLKLDGKKGVLFFNIIDGLRLRKLKKNKDVVLIFRPRGLVPEETYYKKKNIIKTILLNICERTALRKVDYFIFLNNAQKKHFLSKYPFITNTYKNHFILPNTKGTNKLRDIEESSNEVKLVYSGGFSKWQNLDKVYELASDVIKKSSKNVTFTILTFTENFEAATTLAREYDIIDNFYVKYVSPKDLDKELSKFDLGILIRSNHIINQAASPFKLIDYTYNGLGMIVTTGIKDQLEEIIGKENVFEIQFNDKSIQYSSEKLCQFIYKFKEGKRKKLIIKRYNQFVQGIKYIDFKE
ncbi:MULTISPECIES: hypothetical protein [Tetragenococcus]|nr:hypothetical protein [Tetragenococcus koreensis]MCF1680001.1 hypothetical protein [Tetragenococcus koreensis]MCF1687433.1 hypothetical protein [Tetragenococcus koreensis]MCO8288799.1 hypothetical protein [Tetragenococcus halophilus]MDN6839746.1 hypothetical protein [Tetragenococcus halophilus]